MDYDDNDFQSQNFQLVGEDNNRFPSSLQSFSLPKLDLDDHFDVHLRFDPLVETECFLGIQGQENNWIENFSSGSSALDFTSSAAESCSISRHNNVWSEATSSESVEMLLKSVGGDEMINNGSIIKEVGRDQLTGLKGCTDTYYNMDDIIKIDPALPPDKCPKSLSGINDGSITVQSQVDALAQTSEGEKSGVDMDAGSIGERSSSDRESGAEQCTNDRKGTASSDDAAPECVAVPGDVFETAQIENSTDSGLLEKTADDDHVCVAKIDRETPDPDTCSAQANTFALSSGNLMASGKEMEKEGDIPVTKNDSLKHKYGDANLNDEPSIRCAADSTLGSAKSSSCSEASPDPSVLLIKRCSESTFSGNPDELLEAIAHPVKTCNKDGDSGDDTVTRTVQMPFFAMEGGRTIEKHSVETSIEENADRSCRTELEDVRQDLQESYPKDNSCSENIVYTENVKPADEHGMEVKLETAMEVTEENHNTEILEITDNNTSAEAVKQHSSNEQRYGSVGPEVKNGDSLLTRHLDSVLLKVASSDGEKCAADGTFEKEDTADLPQTVLSDKSSSATLVNDTDAAMLSSSSHKSIGMYAEDKSAVEPCDIRATVHRCSVPQCEQPSIHSGGISADSNASIVLGKSNLISAAIQDTTMLEVVNDSLTNNMVHNVTEKRETESPLQQSVNEKLMNFSESSCSALSNAEAQMLEKPVSDPGAMVGLPVEEIIHVQSVASLPAAGVYPAFPTKETNNCESHSEETHVMDVVSEPKQIISSTSDMVQVDKEDVTCMMILKADANPQVAISQTPVDHSGRSSPGRCESDEANKANETSVDAEQHSLESKAENLSSYGPDCVSPETFSCIEVSKDITEQHKGNKGLSDRTGSVRDDQPCISSDTRKSLCSAKPVHNDSKEKNALEDDRNLSFEAGSVGVPSDKSHDESRPSPARKPPQFSQTATKNSQEGHFESEVGEVNGTCTKTIHEDGRQASSGFAEITTTADGKTTEQTPPLKQTTAKDDKQCSTSMVAVVTMSSDIHSEMRQYPCTDASLFFQPFTDLQQVQLRAQIFVYGSIIQGTPPDEACMVSAFGETDGGRGSWEGLLRVTVERFQNQKSPLSGCETPLHSRSGVRIPEQVTRCNSLQSKSHNPPVTKFAPSAVFSSSSFPTPLWSTSARDSLQASMPRGTHLDFNQALSPLHSYQSSQMRHSGNGLSWFPPNYPASVVVPSQCSRLDATPQYSAVPVAVTVQVTPTRDSSASRAAMQLGTASVLLPSPGSSASVATIVPIEVHRKASTSVNNQNSLPVQKSRKRKKTTVSVELEPVLLASQTRSESVTAPVTKSITFSPVQPSSSNSPTKVISSGPVVTTSRIISPTHYQMIGGGNTEQSAILSEETHSRIEQAKVQAEDAAALASAAVRHSQGIWSQLALQKNSGLASEGEEKFASAAVAAAAAAAVAKAAAAAAKVASDAALQAKMMADEALDLVKTGNNSKSSDAGSHVGRKLTMLTPVSILKGKDKFHGSSSVISAAREASRRRVEAASAATKRAENLDAILKAAELAAEAVAQAGIIVAMGDPLPVKLSELAEAGPDNYFKVHCSTSGRSMKTSGQIVSEQPDVDFAGNQDISSKQVNDWPSNHNEAQKISAGDGKSSLGNGLGNALSSNPLIIHERDHSASISLENSISKDSHVEVVPVDDRLRGAWFSAHVLELKDGKAYVCYNDLRDEGSSQRKEWIPLEVDGIKAPRIRIPHPMATINPEGTKKRRRDAVGKYEWSVGDHVDAWRLDGWWEGIITEKSKEDETKLTVHFPAGGETSIFKAWNLRPSLVWKDGQWTHWARLRDITSQPYEGDTPFEKRPKLSRFEANAKSEVDGRGNEETRPMILSAKERIFSAGKNVRGGKSSDPLQMTRTGHEKEGSRVVFGIPKPGKKRKFMDVSQHYVADKTNKTSEGNDSIKLAKFFVPQESRLLSTSKTDARGKRAVNSRPKWPRPVKSQTIRTAGAVEKENSSVSNASASSGGESGQDLALNTRASFDNVQNQLEKKNTLEAGSSFRTLGPPSCTSLQFSVHSVPGVPTSKNSSVAEADPGAKGKLMAVVEKSIRNEEKGFEHPGKAMPESIEPRRSNRRIQPTSRLLEGLQSSLIISKIPSVSHDKGSRALHRGGSSSRGNPHG